MERALSRSSAWAQAALVNTLNRRPKPFEIHPLRILVVRGPRARDRKSTHACFCMAVVLREVADGRRSSCARKMTDPAYFEGSRPWFQSRTVELRMCNRLCPG